MLAILLLFFAALPAAAQTFTVLHTFTDGQDGAQPFAGLAIDRNGTLYGTTASGGINNCVTGCGLVYRMMKRGSGWLFTTLYQFQGEPDGNYPQAITISPNGTLYGMTFEGGQGNCAYGTTGCGTIYNLRPPASFCHSASCFWNETVLHRFTGSEFGDGATPVGGQLTFDAHGNFFGTTSGGGTYTYGTVFEMSPSQGSWTETVLYSFSGGGSGGWGYPESGVLLDASGNLYGTTTLQNQYAGGVLYELSPSGGSWTGNVLHAFECSGDEGCVPGGLIYDPAGNVYAGTPAGGANGGGTAVEFQPSLGWSLNTLFSFNGDAGGGPIGYLAMDAAGNLYGATNADGDHLVGTVFKLTPSSGGGWTMTILHTFTGGSDGAYPRSGVVLDAQGNIYGTAGNGGNTPACNGAGCGVVYEITP